jgi:hypothetical protein
VAVASAGAEEGIFGGQRLGLDPVDGVCARVFGRDGTAALAVSNKRALQAIVSAAGRRGGGRATDRGLGLILVAELLELGKLLFRGQEGRVGHAGGLVVVEVARVWVLVAGGG